MRPTPVAEASCLYCSDFLIPDVPRAKSAPELNHGSLGNSGPGRSTPPSYSARRWSPGERASSVPHVTRPSSRIASGTTSA
jgi:hypothetical protein